MTYIVVGCFGKAHGVRGAITVQSYTDPKANILEYTPWFLKAGGSWKEIDVRLVEQRGNGLIAWINGVENRDQACVFTNLKIAVPETVLPELNKDEYYWQQIIGLSVVNLNQAKLGIVTEMMATGANDVMIVEGDKRFLIPFIMDKYIQSIDLTSGTIVVDWDETF